MISAAIAIICTRKESKRLPGKAFNLICGIPAIEHILKRIKPLDIPVVLAVPNGQGKDYKDFADKYKAYLHEGQDESPLHRMAAVLERWPAKYVVRITHDDILIDHETAQDMIAEAIGLDAGYISPDGIVEGAGVEIISRENLLWAANHRKEPTEFVSYFVKGPDAPNKVSARIKPRDSIRRQYRLTMDYDADAILLETVLRALGPSASVDSICSYLDNHQYLLLNNRLPELAVYTCVYNGRTYIDEAIRSVLLSRWKNEMEYIIVEDCSTDDTIEQILKLKPLGNVRLLVNDRNDGLGTSSNRALAEARGKYIMRLDADDFLSTLEFDAYYPLLKTLMASSEAKAVYPAYYKIENGVRHNTIFNGQESHHVGGAIFDKAFLNELRFRDGIRHWDGQELKKRMTELKTKVAYFDKPTWVYRQRPNSLSRSDTVARERTAQDLGLV